MKWENILKQRRYVQDPRAKELLTQLAGAMASGATDIYDIRKNFERQGFTVDILFTDTTDTKTIDLRKDGKPFGNIVYNVLDGKLLSSNPIDHVFFAPVEARNILDVLENRRD